MKKKTNFIEITKSKKIWAIGSIHSRHNAFKSIKKYLLEKFEKNDSLVFLGNIIGLGKESKKTFKTCAYSAVLTQLINRQRSKIPSFLDLDDISG